VLHVECRRGPRWPHGPAQPGDARLHLQKPPHVRCTHAAFSELLHGCNKQAWFRAATALHSRATSAVVVLCGVLRPRKTTAKKPARCGFGASDGLSFCGKREGKTRNVGDL